MTESYQGWTNAATFGTHLYLVQEKKVYDEIERIGKQLQEGQEKAARVRAGGGTIWSPNPPFPNVNVELLKGFFTSLKIELDEWMEGDINWKEVACNMEKDRGWGTVTCCCGCGVTYNHHEGYTERYGTEFYYKPECYGTLFEVCDLCGGKNLTVRWNAKNKFCSDQKEPEHACDKCLMTKYKLSYCTITSGSMSRGR